MLKYSDNQWHIIVKLPGRKLKAQINGHWKGELWDYFTKSNIRDQNQRLKNNVFALAVENAIIFSQTFN